MKKFMKKYFLVLVMALMICFTTACSSGSTVNTDLTINEDLSGSRVFSIVVDQGVFKDNFQGEPADLYNVVKAYCPSQLEWAYSEENEEWTYIFTLNFSSIEDYQEKVNAIIGEEQNITVQVSDTVWSSGVFVEEGFNSGDLLNWLKDALVEGEYVDSSNAGKIFGDGKTHIIYKGEVNDSNKNIYLNQVKNIELQNVNIFTDVQDFNSFDRTVEFKVYTTALEGDDSKRIEEAFKGYLKNGMKLSIETDDFFTIFKITEKGLTADTLKQFDVALFGAENVNFEVVNKDHTLSPFQFGEVLHENLVLTNYLIGDRYTNIQEYYKLPEGYYIDRDVNITRIDTHRTWAVDNLYPEYLYMYQNWASSKDDEVILLKSLDVASMDIDVKHSKFGKKMTVENAITLAGTPSEEEVAKVVEYLQSLVAPAEEDESEEAPVEGKDEEVDKDAYVPSVLSCKVTVGSKTKDNVSSIIITQKGDANSVVDSNKTIYRCDSSRVDYSRVGSFTSPVKHEAYIYAVDFSNFVATTAEEFGTKVSMNLGMSGKPAELIEKELDGTVEKGHYVESGDSLSVRVSYAGTTVDLFGILFWVFIVAGLGLILFALWKAGIIASLIAKMKERKAAKEEATAVATAQAPLAETQEAPAQVSETETPVAEAPVEAAPAQEAPAMKALFCPNCGTKLAEDAIFCDKCGTKVQ